MLPSSQSIYQPVTGTHVKLERFLVCGLGSLGQHCVAILKEYGAIVFAIDEVQPRHWEIPNVLSLLEALVIGDCCMSEILEQAQIRQCRSVLFVTSSERVNTEAALAARLLNPQIRLVVRSDKERLNHLLSQNLGNFAAFEPNQLSASAFALAALGADTLGYFNLEGKFFRVVKHEIQPDDRWCDRRQVQSLNSSHRRVLSHTSASLHLPKEFYQWKPEAVVEAGDTLVYVEMTDTLISYPQQPVTAVLRALKPTKAVLRAPRWFWYGLIRGRIRRKLKQQWHKFWHSIYRSQNRIQQIATIYGITVFILWLLGVVLFSLYYPEIGIQEALYAPAVLLLGGYGDLFGSIKFTSQPEPALNMPWWLRLFSFGLTLSGSAFVGVLYALITDTLLGARFQFFTKRPPIPKQDHVVLIGLSAVGQRVATLLQELKQPLVGINRIAIEPGTLPQVPLIIGRIVNALTKANLARAKTIIVTMDDDMENLEIGLVAHAANPTTSLVIQTYDRHFSDNVARLFPYAPVLCGVALSAEVFAAAAYGENVLSLFRFLNQTVLVAEYKIEAGDTLNGLILAEIAYGYGVVPILYQKNARESPTFMPSDNIRLIVGDRLIVLATSHSHRRIEWAELAPRNWQVHIEAILIPDTVFDGAREIAQISGVTMETARDLMHHLPATLHQPLYKHQAQSLVRKLSKLQIRAHLIPIANDISS